VVKLLYFENTRCERCGSALGFVEETLQLVALTSENDGKFSHTQNKQKKIYRYCANYNHGVCNWMVLEGGTDPFCKACELNRTIPDISNPAYMIRWVEIEKAKHRLIYSLLMLGLKWLVRLTIQKKDYTLILLQIRISKARKKFLPVTITGLLPSTIAEADDIEREMARKAMDEVYRTLLGHFRHEIGHYYWDRIIDNTNNLNDFRNLFGDDRIDYTEALKKHYENGIPLNWEQQYISSYASTHPWEDWAETWAHYLHIVDTLETAYAFGMSVHPLAAKNSSDYNTDIKSDPYRVDKFEKIIDQWLPLTFAMNSLSRSMGQHDVYPFVISPKVVEKLKFIHRVIRTGLPN
jgi:hypothetical protein